MSKHMFTMLEKTNIVARVDLARPVSSVRKQKKGPRFVPRRTEHFTNKVIIVDFFTKRPCVIFWEGLKAVALDYFVILKRN